SRDCGSSFPLVVTSETWHTNFEPLGMTTRPLTITSLIVCSISSCPAVALFNSRRFGSTANTVLTRFWSPVCANNEVDKRKTIAGILPLYLLVFIPAKPIGDNYKAKGGSLRRHPSISLCERRT